MTIVITFEWWLLPLLVTIGAFVYAHGWSLRAARQSDQHIHAGHFWLLPYGAAALLSLLVWLGWACS
ncbi:hypothetical protein ACEUZ9_005480 [Paracoccus litorisediminis]|uniref:hypothetical protein n=1 Tax=Paracoccus litorisediminis TaxID=2006130 RepID=UPI00372EDC57